MDEEQPWVPGEGGNVGAEVKAVCNPGKVCAHDGPCHKDCGGDHYRGPTGGCLRCGRAMDAEVRGEDYDLREIRTGGRELLVQQARAVEVRWWVSGGNGPVPLPLPRGSCS